VTSRDSLLFAKKRNVNWLDASEVGADGEGWPSCPGPDREEDIMSSALFTPENMRLIERLLAEVPCRFGPSAGREASSARVLHDAVERRATLETDLRRLVAEHVKAWLADARISSPGKLDVPYHRQEHMLPSPEEEFNAAELSFPIGTANHSDTVMIARNAVGETAMIRWQSGGTQADDRGRWTSVETNRPFAATRWVPITWSAQDIRKHSSHPTDWKTGERTGTTPSKSPSVLAAIHAFLDACQKETRPLKTAGVAGSLRRAFPELDISDADLADAIIREVSWAFISSANASAAALERRGLDGWENEGGAIPETCC
jgi:hypothetical protein